LHTWFILFPRASKYAYDHLGVLTEWKENQTRAKLLDESNGRDMAKENPPIQAGGVATSFFPGAKFNADGVMNFAAGLVFNLITAIFPIAMAIIVSSGLIFCGLIHPFKETSPIVEKVSFHNNTHQAMFWNM
jgi:hypothetical protein